MTTLQTLAPAKLNLMLHITGRRDNGYHELQTLFQLLNVGDVVTASEADVISVNCPELNIPQESNLVYKAAISLQQYCGTKAGAHLTINKILPAGGGIGGGSSDAASALLLLNQLWSLELDIDTLAQIGLSLGADVPLFVRGHSAWAEGVGEQLTPVTLPEDWFVVLHPRVHISTAEVFSHPQLTRDTALTTIALALAGGGHNDCESVVRALYPTVDRALNWLSQFYPARLTGTGACIFCRCPSEAEAYNLVKAVPSEFSAFAAKGLNQSPAFNIRTITQ